MKKNLILNHEEIQQKTRRIAYQIVEDNYDEKELVMIGIKPNGFVYAETLKKEIEELKKQLRQPSQVLVAKTTKQPNNVVIKETKETSINSLLSIKNDADAMDAMIDAML